MAHLTRRTFIGGGMGGGGMGGASVGINGITYAHREHCCMAMSDFATWEVGGFMGEMGGTEGA